MSDGINIHIGLGFIKVILAIILMVILIAVHSKVKDSKWSNVTMGVIALILFAGCFAIIDGVWRLL